MRETILYKEQSKLITSKIIIILFQKNNHRSIFIESIRIRKKIGHNLNTHTLQKEDNQVLLIIL